MCGIATVVQLDRSPVDVGQLTAMCAAVGHRGPDGAGYALCSEGSIALASVRLSVVDLPGGAQPLYNEDRTIAVVCNGEIYDDDHHRRALQQSGHVFRSRSDSELLVHLYEMHGPGFISRLNGEFAFVIWDGRRRLVLAARDRAGVKPLYYFKSPRQLLIGSEAKAIFAHPNVPRRLSQDYFMSAGMGVVPASTSAFEHIQSLKPGHFFVTTEDQVGDERPYHEWSFQPEPAMAVADAVGLVREEVTASVKRRLRADVSVHCYLSGGIDSAIVCALMVRHIGKFSAYHVAFPGSAFDESADAHAISRALGARIEVVECGEQALLDNLVRTVEHVELPLANCNAVGKFLLSKLVNAHGHKVCLTGEGADEVFGGYPYFKLEALWQSRLQQRISDGEFRMLWRQFQHLERRSLGSVWHPTAAWRTGRSPYGYPNYLHIRSVESGSLMPILFKTSHERSGLERRFLQEFPPAELGRLHPFNATRRIAFSSLAGALIPPLGDRVEMAHAVECRTPFLDTELLDLASRIPPAHFIDLPRLREKRLLHDAFGDLLPPLVRNGHKHPFLSPRWRSILSTTAGREMVEHYLSPALVRDAGIYRPAAVRMIVNLWKLAPERWSIVRRLDPLIGVMLTAHILHDRFVARRMAPRENVVMRDLTHPHEGRR